MEYLQSNTKSVGPLDPVAISTMERASCDAYVYVCLVALRSCPVCSMAIERSMGCNKMTCSQCSAYFCYKCGKQINGYDHFREDQCVLFDEEEIRQWEDAMQGVRQ